MSSKNMTFRSVAAAAGRTAARLGEALRTVENGVRRRQYRLSSASKLVRFREESGDKRQGMDYGNVIDSAMDSARMVTSVPLPEMRGDMTVLYPQRNERRRRMDRYEEAPARVTYGAVSNQGMNGLAALLTLLGVALVSLCFWLPHYHAANEAAGRVMQVQSSIEETTLERERLAAELEEKTQDRNVGYEAVGIGMISSKGVEVKYLTVPVEVNQDINPQEGQISASSTD